MRICMFIYHYWPGPEGGAEHQCRLLVRELTRLGIAVTVVTAQTERTSLAEENDQGARVIRIPIPRWSRTPRPSVVPSAAAKSAAVSSPSISFLGWRRKANAFINTWISLVRICLFLWRVGQFWSRHSGEFDLAHVHDCTWFAGFVGWLGNRSRTPVICKETTFPVFTAFPPGIPCARRWDRWRRRLRYVALHRDIALDFERKGIKRDRIWTIPNGVEIPGLSGRRPRAGCLLYIGNLTERTAACKAFDVLFKAWVRIAAGRADVELWVAGGGDWTEWKAYVNASGLQDRTHFLGSVQNVSALYSEALALLLPSRQEGISNVLLEAMSWGVPPVVSDIPGNRLLVEDGVTGLVVPVNDAAALAQKTLLLLGDGPLRLRLGEAARRRIEADFAMPAIARRVLSVYEQLVQEIVDP